MRENSTPPSRPAPAATEKDPAARIGRIVKPLLVLSVVTGGLILVYASPLRQSLPEPAALRETLARAGVGAIPLFVLGAAGLIGLGFPRLLICGLAGAVFGFLEGVVLSQSATLLGSYGVFLFVRWGGRDFVVRRWPRVAAATRIFGTHGISMVFLARQLPLSNLLVNLSLGVTPVRHSAFLLGTLLGTMTSGIPAVLMGAGATDLLAGRGVWTFVAAASALFIIWVLSAEFVRRSPAGAAALRRTRKLFSK